MTVSNRLESSFLAFERIPDQYRPSDAIEQRESLVNGALHLWQGPLIQVRSPVCLTALDGIRSGLFPFSGRKYFAEGTLSVQDALRVFRFARRS